MEKILDDVAKEHGWKDWDDVLNNGNSLQIIHLRRKAKAIYFKIINPT